MRVTLETKAATRQGILDAARRLFAGKGFDATTTRDIAQAAGIASGTLFNYFETKEALLACLAADASADALREFETRRPAAGEAARATLEEDLFALVAASLRKLKPFRRHLPVLLETALSPLAAAPGGDAAALRTGHLEAVARLAAAHRRAPLSATALQLYWTLYTGALVFWASDASPKQEDTLALIDDSLDMYVAWLRSQPADASPPEDAAPGND